MISLGVISFFVGFRHLKLGEEVAEQAGTLRIVMISFLEILIGGLALAALATRIVEPIVVLAVTVGTVLLALLGFRNLGKSKP
jgi:hypothetical protein